MKLRLLNETRIPFNLSGVDSIKVVFPYHNGEQLIKSGIDIVDANDGMILVALTEFEKQGLPEGEITFWAHVKRNDEAYTFEFRKAFTVKVDGERKVMDYQ